MRYLYLWKASAESLTFLKDAQFTFCFKWPSENGKYLVHAYKNGIARSQGPISSMRNVLDMDFDSDNDELFVVQEISPGNVSLHCDNNLNLHFYLFFKTGCIMSLFYVPLVSYINILKYLYQWNFLWIYIK